MAFAKCNENENINNNPSEILVAKAKSWIVDDCSLDFAKRLDEEDPLKEFRSLFHYPKKKNLPCVDLSMLEVEEEEAIYFCGQSLGLQMKSVEHYISKALMNWATCGNYSHYHGFLPAAFCDVTLKEKMASIVGAEANEIAIMNGLTVNIHILMASFYRPTAERHKILMQDHGFPSDLFAIQSQIRLHGYSPEDSIIFLKPRKGEQLLNFEDISSVIEKEGRNISVVYFEGVHYYSGQLLDIERITKISHKQGCVVGFDLAHAVGNVKLQLHEWEVDFALWCTYKYLNSGAGCLASVFIHSHNIQHGINDSFPLLRGWWGVDPKVKFEMRNEFKPTDGADVFRLSNPSPFLISMMLPNLELFQEVGIDQLIQKQFYLTGYLEYLLKKIFPKSEDNTLKVPCVSIITPSNPKQRGSQLSLIFSVPLDSVEEKLERRGIVCDIRLPSVMRVTPIPLYNTYTEVFNFVRILKEVLSSDVECKTNDTNRFEK